jgi:hypothetical protein
MRIQHDHRALLMLIRALVLCAGLFASEALSQGLTFKRRSLLDSIDVPLNPSLFGITRWKVGESSKYKVTLFHPDYLEVFHLTFSVVGEEIRDSQSLFWLETDVQPVNSPQERIINKILRPFGNLTRFTEGAVGEILSQVGDNPPLAVPSSILNVETSSPKPRGGDWTQVDLGHEEIKVAAGDFKARKQKFVDSEKNSADVWFTGKVGPLGIVKVSRNQWNLELVAYESKGSVSAIYGSPIRISPP